MNQTLYFKALATKISFAPWKMYAEVMFRPPPSSKTGFRQSQ
jgi:hypothetical protein